MKTKRGHRPYASNWHGYNGIAARTCNATIFRRCVVCWFRRATLAHHFYYIKGLLKKPIYGKEVPGLDVVGVCDRCHGVLHSKKHWSYAKNADGDRNTPEVIATLRFNFFLLSTLKYWWIALAVLMFFIAR